MEFCKQVHLLQCVELLKVSYLFIDCHFRVLATTIGGHASTHVWQISEWVTLSVVLHERPRHLDLFDPQLE